MVVHVTCVLIQFRSVWVCWVSFSLAFLFTALSQGRQKHAIPWATADLEPCAATDPDLEAAAVWLIFEHYGTMAWGIWYIRKYPVVSSSDGKVNGERTIAVLWDFNISSPISSVLRTHASCKILCFGVSNISRVSIFHLGKTRRSPADLARGQESLPELMFHSADQI